MPKRDPWGEKVFFSVGRDSEGCLYVEKIEQQDREYRKYREFLEEAEEELVPDILIKCIIKELVPLLKKEKKEATHEKKRKTHI